ncbi:Hsp20/alpha crystallin family protein [Cyclobacterium jeungdonense]|uniref:Hsp20/alpha crystallin family protein n=1 Tax=Cyclobacterium jeungdonense TaxID=708087 RepID=A0ABT8C3G4_9BACT|nr:Hsp20/alpha crystallin family protein [Cyclobacterium jeungdonense]MDN3686281.1 Hsp20/alpha crystallin family protein [Cyclobacterium jeungdonense]
MKNVISKNGWKPGSEYLEDAMSGDWLNFTRKGVNTAYVPMVNILETDEAYRIHMGLPGMNKNDFNVELDNQVITISGSTDQKNDGNQSQYLMKEFNYHSFTRSFQLPNTIDTDQIEAKFENGMLTLFLPKREEARRRPIKIIDIS